MTTQTASFEQPHVPDSVHAMVTQFGGDALGVVAQEFDVEQGRV
jgi:hypothetical protein